jgi:glycosyltransferase involved in cell wall biosynthesis
VYQENRGANEARNLGAQVACGKYVTFLDSDDEALATWLAAMNRAIAETQAEVVCCGIRFIAPDGATQQVKVPDAGHAASGQGGVYLSGTYCIRRDLFRRLGGFRQQLRANQHSEFRCRLLAAAQRHAWALRAIPEVLVLAHEHEGPKIRRNTRDVFDSSVYILTEHAAVLKENPRTYADWAAACAGTAAALGRYADARAWFWKAMCARPAYLKNYCRLLVASVPLVRGYVWRRVSQATAP